MNKNASLPIILAVVMLAFTAAAAICLYTNALGFVEILFYAAQDLAPTAAPIVYPSGSKADLVDRSILTHEPCAPPCWHGIVPGQTTADEAEKILAGLPFVRTHTSYGEHSFIWYSSLTDWGRGYLNFNDSRIITSVRFPLEFILTIKELAAIEGTPDGYSIITTGNPHDAGYIGNRVYWLRSGIIAETAEDHEPSPDSTIGGFEYTTAPIKQPTKEEGFRAWPSQ